MTDSPTAEKAQSAASSAADETRHVAGVAQDEVKKVAGEASAQLRSVVGDARTQVGDQLGDQTRQQRDHLVSTLGTFGTDLEQMADAPDGGLAADVAREVAAHARNLTSYLDGREPGQMLEDVRDLARRRPAVFLVGALAAGVVVGRLARGVKDAPSAGASSTSSTPVASPVAEPVATPVAEPVVAPTPEPTGGVPSSVVPVPTSPVVPPGTRT